MKRTFAVLLALVLATSLSGQVKVKSCSAGAGATYPIIVQQQKDCYGEAANYTCTFPAPTTAGNAIVIVYGNMATTAPTVADDKSNTYTVATSCYDVPNARTWAGAAYKLNATAGTQVVTVTNAYSASAAHIYEVSGVTAVDGSNCHANGYITNSQTLTSNSITTTGSDLLVGGHMQYYVNNAITFTVGSGWTDGGSPAAKPAAFFSETRTGAAGSYAADGTATCTSCDINSVSVVIGVK